MRKQITILSTKTRQLIIKVMIAKGLKTRTEIAEKFGISRKTLYSRLKKHNIKLPSGKIGVNNQKKIIKALNE